MDSLPSLYPVVNVAADAAAAIERARRLAASLVDAGAPILQLRAKELGAGRFVALARALGQLGAHVLINDRVDVALAAEAAGVHVGDEDLPPLEARALLGDEALLGYSTHSTDEIRAAQALPVDYLAFGPVFESPTKRGVRAARGLDALAEACRLSRLPVVAIGGITIERAPSVWAAGAASVAVIRELERARDVAALVARYRDASA